jgi:putative transposase
MARSGSRNWKERTASCGGERDPEGRQRLFRPGTRPPASALVEFIDSHKDRFGVEPACAVLEISPSTYYAAKRREEDPPARDARDEELKKEIMRAWKEEGRGVYGARKVWRELNREGIEVARCTVERLMRELGIAGAAARRRRPHDDPGRTGARAAV